MAKKSNRVPEPMREKYDRITRETDAFCDLHLDTEYRDLTRLAIAALCRKRPSPLARGQENTWAAGVVHAVGMVNFLFDKSQTPHCKSPVIHEHFGVAASTMQNKSKEIRDLLKMYQLSPDWMRPSRIAESPVAWLLQVNGMIVDARHMPRELQEIAYEKGLIPYIPADRPNNSDSD